MTTDGMACSGGGVHSGGGVPATGSGNGRISQQLTWEKLSPEEFQQLQDFAACKSNLFPNFFLKAFKTELSGRIQRMSTP
jgi:hypothetical protein